jgi:hypothetical protein
MRSGGGGFGVLRVILKGGEPGVGYKLSFWVF